MANPVPQDGSTSQGNRGIQNAQARFEEKSRERLLSEQIQKRGTVQKGSISQKAQQRQELDTILREDPILASQYEQGTADLILKNRPIAPHFPVLMFIMALIKDALDSADFTIFGMIFTTSLSFIFAIILFFWLFSRLSGGWWKKRLLTKLWTRYIIMIAIESIPIVKIIPATTILVLMAHYSETKIVKAFTKALENMRGKVL